MNEVTSAGIVVYKMHDNKPLYLVMHYASGHWDFSKGHLEAGESSREAAIRELMEEAGITATIDPDFQASIQYIVQDYRSNQLSLKQFTFLRELQILLWWYYRMSTRHLNGCHTMMRVKSLRMITHVRF